MTQRARCLVVGAGLSGLVAAIRLRRAGNEVTLITRGIGGIQLGHGAYDILGYTPELVLDDPLGAAAKLGATDPDHPYAKLDAERIRAGFSYLAELLPGWFVGDLTRNYLLPTAVGALRPTAMLPATMAAGECVPGRRMLIVGLRQLKDFWPELISGNLNRTPLPGGGLLEARPAWVDLPARAGEVDSTALRYANAMDDPSWRGRFIAALKPLVRSGEHIGLPAILGLRDPGVHLALESALGLPVFEIACLPPSVPGMRVNEALTQLAKQQRINIVLGAAVTGSITQDDRITGLRVAAAGREQVYRCDQVVFAPGGFESGGIEIDSYLEIREPALGLPVWRPEGELVVGDHGADQPLFRCGVRTDSAMRAVDAQGNVRYSNLYLAGGILAGAARWREKSGEGIALASAMTAVDSILGGNHV